MIDRGTSQLKLSRALGWSHTKLNRLVKMYDEPSKTDIDKICHALGVSEAEILDASYETR